MTAYKRACLAVERADWRADAEKRRREGMRKAAVTNRARHARNRSSAKRQDGRLGVAR